MDKREILNTIQRISEEIDRNREYLIELDRQAGDGDLGISMSDGFHAVLNYLEKTNDVDMAKIWSQCGNVFNEAAPSSLGTIFTFIFKGMAVSMKGLKKFDMVQLSCALDMGIKKAMEKAGSSQGEKTIFDSLIPAVESMLINEQKSVEMLKEAAKAAAYGCEMTRNMQAVWGRAAYYGEDSIGKLDGGAVVGMLIFKAMSEYSE